MKPLIWTLVAAAVIVAPVARADTTFTLPGDVDCDENTMSCSETYSYFLPAIVGIDTVYAPDGTTVLETLTDVVIGSPLGPTLAYDIANDGSTFPTQLETNLAPFTTWSDLQYLLDNNLYDFFPTACPVPPNEMLTQAGNLINSGITFENVTGGTTSPSIYTDLTGAVSNATVTSDTVSEYGVDAFNVSATTTGSYCGEPLPDGYPLLLVQTVVVDSYVENITEVENSSSAPEPASWMLALAGIAILFRRRPVQ